MQHVSVVSVPVRDQARSKRFCAEQVGLQEIIDVPCEESRRWVQLGFELARTTISLVTWFESMPAGSLRGLVSTATTWRPTTRR